jgi:hypothetical protein
MDDASEEAVHLLDTVHRRMLVDNNHLDIPLQLGVAHLMLVRLVAHLVPFRLQHLVLRCL